VVIWQHMFSMPVMRTVWRRQLDCSLCLYSRYNDSEAFKC